MLVEGRIAQMVVMLIAILVSIYYVESVKKGLAVSLRSIPAFDAIDEVVGRSAETGRPVHFTPGMATGGLYNPTMGPQITAGISILKKVAESCAKLGTSIIVSLNQAEAVPLCEEIVQYAYRAEGEVLPRDAVRFISQEKYGWVAGVLATLREESPAANILTGFFWCEALLFAEGAAYVGAMQIAGTAEITNLPFLVAACDYCLIGEELYAAKAYVERDHSSIGSLLAQDFMRFIFILIMLLVLLGTNLKLPWIVSIFRT